MRPSNESHIPLPQALGWILASVVLITGPIALGLHLYRNRKHPQPISAIVQTGPKRGALNTECLAEMLGLSADVPVFAKNINPKAATAALRASPLIQTAEVKIDGADTLFVDYTVRQPIAWLEDWENVVLDKEGHLFPFAPFFSPKHLPSVYLGLPAFGSAEDWTTPLTGLRWTLFCDLYQRLTAPEVSAFFPVKRIDLSHAFAESYGRREVVVWLEEKAERGGVVYVHPRLLRLSSKNYAQELGNYLQLRPQLLEHEERELPAVKGGEREVRLRVRVIDLRLAQLGFIDG